MHMVPRLDPAWKLVEAQCDDGEGAAKGYAAIIVEMMKHQGEHDMCVVIKSMEMTGCDISMSFYVC